MEFCVSSWLELQILHGSFNPIVPSLKLAPQNQWLEDEFPYYRTAKSEAFAIIFAGGNPYVPASHPGNNRLSKTFAVLSGVILLFVSGEFLIKPFCSINVFVHLYQGEITPVTHV